MQRLASVDNALNLFLTRSRKLNDGIFLTLKIAIQPFAFDFKCAAAFQLQYQMFFILEEIKINIFMSELQSESGIR